jgi:hypothetical protein
MLSVFAQPLLKEFITSINKSKTEEIQFITRINKQNGRNSICTNCQLYVTAYLYFACNIIYECKKNLYLF